MRFEEAMNRLRTGKTVYRSCWTETESVIRLDGDRLVDGAGFETTIGGEDIIAEDWEVLSDEENPCVQAVGFKRNRPYPVLRWDTKQDEAILTLNWGKADTASIYIPIGLWRRVVADIGRMRRKRGYEGGER